MINMPKQIIDNIDFEDEDIEEDINNEGEEVDTEYYENEMAHSMPAQMHSMHQQHP